MFSMSIFISIFMRINVKIFGNKYKILLKHIQKKKGESLHGKIILTLSRPIHAPYKFISHILKYTDN